MSMLPYIPKFAYNKCTQIAGIHVPQNSIYMQIVDRITPHKKSEYRKAYIWVDMKTVLTKTTFKVNYLSINDKFPHTLKIYKDSKIQKLLREFAEQKFNEFGEVKPVQFTAKELSGFVPNNRLVTDYKNWH